MVYFLIRYLNQIAYVFFNHNQIGSLIARVTWAQGLSESGSALRNVYGLEDLGAGLAQSLLSDALLVHCLDSLLDLLDCFVAEQVAAESHAEVVWRDGKRVLDFRHTSVVYLVETDVQVLELGVDQQVPLGYVGAVFVLNRLALDRVQKGYGLFGLFACLQLLVLFEDRITFLKLQLVRGYLFYR